MSAIDYSLFAPKLFVSEILRTRIQVREKKAPVHALGRLIFQRVWLQGTIVATSQPGRVVLDDGSGTVELDVSKQEHPQSWMPGMYIMVVGLLTHHRNASEKHVKAHKIVDLSSAPDREPLWTLEVIEAHQKFYNTLIFQ
eukprot:TRINITY_DN4447_c0_g1_i1.p1 TRINITY_DN4447_c0_g1~~TRINITY_DN4447_c0_g1_i1.p1  ORF type:complete len:140 (-),score=24.08 TRINITY_DN4447_c0_g1_i1:297-716(-)